MTAIDVGGSWVGHYEQHGGRHGISMHVVQRGESFVGRMRDVDTMLAGRAQMHAQSGDGDERTSVLVGEAEVLSTLPEHSIVEGEVAGRVVTFVKRYQGNTTTNVWLADAPGKQAMTFDAPGHDVHYLGTLDAAGTELAGHWSIPGRHGLPALRDRFVLRRIAR
jgi:hypothetical protein